MARFKIISKDGKSIRYEGKPRYVGTYLKPSFLEFNEIASPTPIAWEVGDYVDYPRTGMRYYLYSIPQASKNATKNSHGKAFTYSGVQLHAATKELEIAPFRDIVASDNNIHFSTSPDVTTFEDIYGIALRIQECMNDLYPDRWEIRVADFDDADIIEKVTTKKDFALSGGTCLDALSKIYELWQDIGWIHTYDKDLGKEVITIGYANALRGDNVSEKFLYGKGNGLTAIKKNQINKEEFATRLYVYGSERNLPPRYYSQMDFPNAESADIRNLMLPLDAWGLTNGSPDPRKAYLQNDEAVAKYGVIPKTHYFDSDDAGANIYPTIKRLTIGEIRDVIASDNPYYPSSLYSDTERADIILGASNPSDDGVSNREGKRYEDTKAISLQISSPTIVIPEGSTKEISRKDVLFNVLFEHEGMGEVSVSPNMNILVQGIGIDGIIAEFELSDDITKQQELLEAKKVEAIQISESTWSVSMPKMSLKYNQREYESFRAYMVMRLIVTPISSSERTLTIIPPTTPIQVNFSRILPNTFNIKLKQIGFNIEERASQGKGKTISMKSGMCEGRGFVISSCVYDDSDDSWNLICRRQKDETLGVLFPNADYPVQSGDEFILLDIAMPDSYIHIAANRLLEEGEKLLSKASKAIYNYEPAIDARVMAESGRKLREGMFMEITDEDIVDNTTEYILIDTLNINEDESAIPAYRITLRERRKVTYKGTPSATSPSSTSSVEEESEDDNSKLLQRISELEFLKDMFYWHDEAKTIIATNHSLIVKDEMASAGTGADNDDSGSVSVMNSWNDYNPNITQALGAILGVELHERLTAVEGGISEYATISFVEKAISDLIGGADGAYDTLLEIQQILQGNEASIGTILEEIGKKASKEDLAALELRVKAIEDAESEDMFAWADEEHTTIETEKNLVVKGDFSDAGVAGEVNIGITSIVVDGVTYPDSDRDGVIDLTGAFENINVNLDNYYTKTEVYNKQETYSKEEINGLIADGESDMFAWADEAKTTIKTEKNLIVEGELSDSGVAGNVTVGISTIRIDSKDYTDTDRDGIIDLTDALKAFDFNLEDYATKAEVSVISTKVNSLVAWKEDFSKYIYIDEDDHDAHVDTNLIVSGDISDSGVGETPDAIGTVIGVEVNGVEYTDVTGGILDLSDAFNNVSVDLSDYYTIAQVDKKIDDLNVGQYATTDALTSGLKSKQDKISDLATIRNNASDGATAYEWGNHADAGYAKASSVASKTAFEALRNEFDALESALNDDVSGKINTWNEIVDFLDEYSGSQDLETILVGINADIAKRALQSDLDSLSSSVGNINNTVTGHTSSIGSNASAIGVLQGFFTDGVANQAAKVTNALAIVFNGTTYAFDGSVAKSITFSATNLVSAIGTTPVNRATADASGNTITSFYTPITAHNALVTKVSAAETNITAVSKRLAVVETWKNTLSEYIYVEDDVVHVTTDIIIDGDIATAADGEGGGSYASIGIIVGNSIAEYPNTAGVITLSKETITSGIGLGELAFTDNVSWGDVVGRPTSLSQFTDDVVSGKYLPLGGGNVASLTIGGHTAIHSGNIASQTVANALVWKYTATLNNADADSIDNVNGWMNLSTGSTNMPVEAGTIMQFGAGALSKVQLFAGYKGDSSSSGAQGLYYRKYYSDYGWDSWKEILTTDKVTVNGSTLSFGSAVTIGTIGGKHLTATLPSVFSVQTSLGLGSLAYEDSLNWSEIEDKPTTLIGYGITDAYTKAVIDSKFAGYQPLSTAINSDNIGSQSVAYATNAGNANALEGLNADSFARCSYNHQSGGDVLAHLTSGMHRWGGSVVNAPAGGEYGNSLVVRGSRSLADTAWLLYGNYSGDKLFYRSGTVSDTLAKNSWRQIAFIDSDITGNAATATALQYSVSLWGNDFDGTEDVSGALSGVTDINGVLHINSSGYVGIAIADPQYQLDVFGTGRFTGLLTANSGIELPTGQAITFGGDRIIFRQASDNAVYFGTADINDVPLYVSARDIYFRYKGTSVGLSLRNTGNILINQTGDAGYRLDVGGTGRFTDLLSLSGGAAIPTGKTLLLGSESLGATLQYLTDVGVEIDGNLVVTGDFSDAGVADSSSDGGYASIGIIVGNSIAEYPNTNGIIVLSEDLIREGIGLGELAYKDSLTKSDVGLGSVTNLAASDYLTALSSNATYPVSITVGGTTKRITAATLKSSLGLGNLAYWNYLEESDIPDLSDSYLSTSGGSITGNLALSTGKAITFGGDRIIFRQASDNAVYFGTADINDVPLYVSARDIYFRYKGTSVGLSLRNTGNILINQTGDAGYRLDVGGTGRFTGEVQTGSDIRYKNVMDDIVLDIRRIAQAPLFTFKWNDRDDDVVHLGTSAQYWLGVCPWLVGDEGFKSLNYATLGVAIGISNSKQGINHEERIEVLEGKVELHEERIMVLERTVELLETEIRN